MWERAGVVGYKALQVHTINPALILTFSQGEKGSESTLAGTNKAEYNGSIMAIVVRTALCGVRHWAGEVLDGWLPPGDVPEDVGDWRPDEADAYCPRCGASAGEGSVTPGGCAFCLGRRPAWHRLTRLSHYGPPMDEWIRMMKFGRRWRYTSWMGQLLAEAIGDTGASGATSGGGGTSGGGRVVCAVPMPWFRRWRRGYNQADLLGHVVAKELGCRFAPVLKRTRHVPPQTTVARSRRHDNVRHSFGIASVDLTGRDVILVDDVKTSGATLSACSRLLKKAGARSIHVAVVAVADPKGRGYTST